jgi:nitroimidazol reductase NimA-like FMN-containing flavoprotein (pyridoxamine 5'-phosphate oxidase superfamily)
MTPLTRGSPRRAPTPAAAAAAAARSTRMVAPHIVPMRTQSCIAMLEAHSVGRMAYTFRDRVNITPIHYVYHDGWLFARTSLGEKMTTVRHVPWVAFEVDETHGVFQWKSVVVHGTAYTMERDGGPTEAQLWSTGIELLKRIVPDTGTERDPVPYRSLVFGIHVDRISGRACSPVRVSRSVGST